MNLTAAHRFAKFNENFVFRLNLTFIFADERHILAPDRSQCHYIRV